LLLHSRRCDAKDEFEEHLLQAYGKEVLVELTHDGAESSLHKKATIKHCASIVCSYQTRVQAENDQMHDTVVTGLCYGALACENEHAEKVDCPCFLALSFF